ncbi:MAG: penicillin acylase family protein [Chryseotalea sp.]
MRIVPFLASLIITLIFFGLLSSSHPIGGNRIPPLGKFLDPFHGFWQNIETHQGVDAKEISLAGLQKRVTIYHDSLLIPHIFADTDADLYLAQGYVTAMHRLWQMEFQTHAAAGRISEIVGAGKDNAVLNYDRSQRRLGMVYAAQKALEGMMSSSTSKLAVEQYTDGVNQYLKSLSYKDFPFEYKLLDYEPETWTTLKCALLLRSMAQTLNMGDKDIEMTNALTLFGRDAVDLLYPDREKVGEPIVSKPGQWKFDPVVVTSKPLALPDELIKIQQKIPGSDPTTGSNNWAVHGSKTETGSPMLSSDPHLSLSLPSIWFAIQLHTNEVNVMGASLPGAPHVIIGFTDSVAWAVTNAQRDLVDWYKIEFKDAAKNKYLLDGNWVDSKKVTETFALRDGEPYIDTVIYTHWGPVVYDDNFQATDNLKHYAFRWIAHDVSNESQTFYELNRAKNYTDYMKALNHYSGPAQNFAFASVQGDVAMRVQGKFPVRRKQEGKFVLDGTLTTNGWQAFIPNEHNVMEKNPLRGFVSSANQYPADSTYPYYIHASTYEAYRNRRINDVLGKNPRVSIQDVMKLHSDNFNLKAAESLPYFLQSIESISALNNDERKAIEILRTWNYFNEIESEGASYYEAWWDALVPLLWDELRKENTSLSYPTAFQTIFLLKNYPDLSWFDNQATPEKENAQLIVLQAFRESVKQIAKWKEDKKQSKVSWADYKGSYIGHLLRIQALNIPVRHGGNHDIVNAHSRTHGPSWRMVTSLEKTKVKTWATYPGGQSGNPGSPYYDRFLERWTQGRYFELDFMQTLSEETKTKSITFTPLLP